MPSGSVSRLMFIRLQWHRRQRVAARREVGLDVAVNARLEVAVAGEDCRSDQVVFDDGFSSIASSGPELPMQVVQP